MRVPFAIAGFIAVSAFASAAHAETTPEKSDRPWYDRFTASAGLSDQDKGFTASESRMALSFAPSAKWGVTLNLQNADRTVTAAPKDETSFGAFYNVSPRFRVGGQVSVAGQPITTRLPTAQDQPAAGVKLESAFKF
ncbi:MAG: hypothetical protein KJS97_03815 [Alphaproteobacteria bacterium]|nr:hypothetical protein [Alphaproteobacteria bacterium]